MANQTITPATPDQILAFKQGAAQRYKARGVKPEQADALFNAHMSKLAEQAGLPVVDTVKCEKIAAAIKAKLRR